MANLFQYLKKELSTKEDINELDGLVFAWLSYFNYPERLNQQEHFAIKELTEKEIKKKYFYKDASNPQASRKLMLMLRKDERFGSLILSDFEEKKNGEEDVQFGAVTAHLSPSLHVISFRGTDPSFIGWEEDFLMSLERPVKCQELALDYLNRMVDKFHGEFILCGHSKGGNMAIYALSNSKPSLTSIKEVYIYDNPGLTITLEDDYSDNIKIHRFVPQSSIIGTFFDQPYPSIVVKSGVFFFLQHDTFSWKIKKNSFVMLKDRTEFSYRVEKAFNEWVKSLSIEEREKFTRMLFGMLKDSKANDLLDLMKKFPKYGLEINRIYKSLTDEDRRFFKKVIRRFIDKYRLYRKISRVSE